MKYNIEITLSEPLTKNEENDVIASVHNLIANKREVSIMDDTNAHNKKLVKIINKIYNEKDRNFNIIVNALAIRDKEECYEKDVMLPISHGDEYDYLMHVADDEDLKVIINFVRLRDENDNYLFV